MVRTREILSKPDVKFPNVYEVSKRPDGKYNYLVDDWFMKYNTPADSFNSHVSFLKYNPRYKKVFEVLNDPNRVAEEIAKAGYATDPNYATSLKQMIQSVTKRLPKK